MYSFQPSFRMFVTLYNAERPRKWNNRLPKSDSLDFIRLCNVHCNCYRNDYDSRSQPPWSILHCQLNSLLNEGMGVPYWCHFFYVFSIHVMCKSAWMHHIWVELKMHNCLKTKIIFECLKIVAQKLKTSALPKAIFIEWGDFTRAGKTNAFG